MKYIPQNLLSKQNKPIQIKEGEQSDAQNLLDLKLSYLQNSETIPLLPEEYIRDHLGEKELIKSYKQEPNSIILVAFHEGEMIGNLDLTGSERSRMKHTAMLGMGISREWQNERIGSLLLGQSIKWAKSNTDLELICLEVYASNLAGLALYCKFGFVESGRTPGFFRHENTYFDKVQMYLSLD